MKEEESERPDCLTANLYTFLIGGKISDRLKEATDDATTKVDSFMSVGLSVYSRLG